MIARASSGSRSAINSVEPLMSANSAVTVLRSPSMVDEPSDCSPVMSILGAAISVGGGLTGEPPVLLSISTVPHSPQNLSPGSLGALHRTHLAASEAPQSAQN